MHRKMRARGSARLDPEESQEYKWKRQKETVNIQPIQFHL